MFFIMLGILTVVLPEFQALWAQDGPVVARISLVQGDVSALRADSPNWLAATANGPVVTGGILATGPGSRTELQLDNSNVLRLSQSTEAHVADLTRTRIQIQVAAGLISFAVLRGAEADVEIDTPNIAVHALGEGLYRVQVYSPDYSQVTVYGGRAQVITSQGKTMLGLGQIIYVKGTAAPEYQMAPSVGKDDWDRWNDERDHNLVDAQAWQYTNRYYTGSADLDRYGDWVQVPGYGWCWTPYVEAGWAPYRQGRWVSDPYYAWMWVGYEPWGWAPYHYGRWLFSDGNWCWWPGAAKGVRPVWEPGYVAFLGLGGHPADSGQGVEFDSVAWCPLGPHDQFIPWWGPGGSVSTTSLSSLNAPAAPDSAASPVYGSVVAGLLTDPNLRAAVSTASAQDFANGRFGRDLYPVNQAILEQGSLLQGSLPVTPTQASVQTVDRGVNRAALPSAAVHNRQFFTWGGGQGSHSSAPSAQTALAQVNSSREMPTSSLPPASGLAVPPAPQGVAGTLLSTAPAAQPLKPPTGPSGASTGWRAFGGGVRSTRAPAESVLPKVEQAPKSAPAPAPAPPPAAQPSPFSGGGWRHFGPPPAPNTGSGASADPKRQTGWKQFNFRQSGKPPAPPGNDYKI